MVRRYKNSISGRRCQKTRGKSHEKGDTDGVVDDVECTLGTDSDLLLAICYKTFGETGEPHTLSSYIKTLQGVILSKIIKMHNI